MVGSGVTGDNEGSLVVGLGVLSESVSVTSPAFVVCEKTDVFDEFHEKKPD